MIRKPCLLAVLVCSHVATAQTPQTSPVADERGAATQPATTEPAATQPAEAEKVQKPFDILNNDQLTGDWWGARTALKNKGIEFGLSVNSQFFQKTNGGARIHRNHQAAGSGDYELTLDLEKMGVLKGGTFYCLAESVWGSDLAEKVGNFLAFDGDAIGNIGILARQVWYEQKFFDGKVRVRAGRLTVYGDFDTNAYANSEDYQFLNGALINVFNMPTPAEGMGEGLGAQAIIQPVDWFYFGAVAEDAQSQLHNGGFHTTFHDEDYFFSIFELGFLPVWKTPWGKLPGGYRFGLWYDPQPKPQFFNDLGGRRRTIPMKSDDLGFYFNMDQLIFKEKPKDDADAQGLGIFFRYGYAPQDVNLFEHFWSIGAQYQGLIPTRDDDVLGFGFAQGRISGTAEDLGNGDQESVYELYYNIKVFPWLHVSPDCQYIVNPGAVGGQQDAFIIGLRILATF